MGGVDHLKNREQLVGRMKELRAELELMVAEGRVLTSQEVLQISQQLDDLVVDYQRWMLPKHHSRSPAETPVLPLEKWGRGSLPEVLRIQTS